MKKINFIVTALIFSSSLNSFAQEANIRRSAPPKTDWSVTVGFAPVYSPVFQGASDYGFSIFPDLRVRYKDDFFASVPDGIGYNIINNDSWKLGPLTKIRFGREEETGGSPFLISGETNALRGLGNIDSAYEIGGFAEYTFEKIRSRLEVRQGFGGHEGYVADYNINYFDKNGPLSYSFGPRISYGSGDFMNVYYGISQQQSNNSGLSRYEANSGIESYGLGGASTLPLTDNTAVTLFGGFDLLGDNVKKSPLIIERGQDNQFTLGLAYGYRFGWNE